jgi:putative endonuclease
MGQKAVSDGGRSRALESDRRRRSLGQRGEAIAVAYLQRHGYAILARNWRCAVGELDIVARDGDCLALVEVRARHGDTYGSAEDSITPRKQAKLVEVAQTYLQATAQEDSTWRIDVIAIQIGPGDRVLSLNHIRNAVEGV